MSIELVEDTARLQKAADQHGPAALYLPFRRHYFRPDIALRGKIGKRQYWVGAEMDSSFGILQILQSFWQMWRYEDKDWQELWQKEQDERVAKLRELADELAAETLIPHDYMPTVVKYTAQIKTLQKKTPNGGKTEKPVPTNPISKKGKAAREAK